jgi:signal transduction histidine kinase
VLLTKRYIFSELIKKYKNAEITVSSSLNGNLTQIVFRDNGISIPEKDQQKIFRKFERSMSVIDGKLGFYGEFIINLPNEV